MEDEQMILVGVIPLLTPLVVAGIKAIAPKIPKVVLPWLTPFLGVGIDLIAFFSGLENVGALQAALLGLAGVGVREAIDQVKKQSADLNNPRNTEDMSDYRLRTGEKAPYGKETDSTNDPKRY